MKGNIIVAAGVLGALLVLASVVLVVGVNRAADRAMARFESVVRAHGTSVRSAGEQVGGPTASALRELAETTRVHAGSIERAGGMVAKPTVRMGEPVEVRQPVMIQGPNRDGALPVNAKIGKDKD